MLVYMLSTNKYKHEYSFKFKDEKYHVYSIVRLTDWGKRYLNSHTDEAILTEVFINWNENRCWKYEFKTAKPSRCIVSACTDVPPEKLIEEVVSPASGEYMLREVCGPQMYSLKASEKHVKKDWDIPEVRTGWIIFFAVSLCAFIFKDWYVIAMIQIAAICFFCTYRKQYIDANTTYTHNKDMGMLKKKYEVLYGLKDNKENTNHE